MSFKWKPQDRLRERLIGFENLLLNLSGQRGAVGMGVIGHFGSSSILGRCLIAKLEFFSYLRLEYDFLPELGDSKLQNCKIQNLYDYQG